MNALQALPHVVSKHIVEQWKALSPEHSRAYSVLSATFAETKKSQPAASQRRKRARGEKDPKAPKAATSAYMYYSKHHRNVLKQENSDLSFGDLGKTVGAMWKCTTPEERRPFEEQAALDKDRYQKQATAYKTQGPAAGGDEAKKQANPKTVKLEDGLLLGTDVDLEDDAMHVLSDDDAEDDGGGEEGEDEDEDGELGDGGDGNPDEGDWGEEEDDEDGNGDDGGDGDGDGEEEAEEEAEDEAEEESNGGEGA
jgi:hypothetical protein